MPLPRLPWIGLAVGLGAVLFGMAGFWVRGYDNYDRALIFLATAWLLAQYLPKLRTLPDTPKPGLGLALVAFGALAFLPPWFVFAQIGPRPIILWWEALALISATVGVILIRSGPRLLKEVRFLLIFPLFALPLPGRIQNPLHEIMQAISADIGAQLIPLFGVKILAKHANSIILENGEGIHVAEVCSGLYMIRTTLSIAAFLAHWCKFNLARSLVLMATSIPVIILVNALRVAAFGLLQNAGMRDWVMPGFKHELIGYIAYIPGLLLVLAVVKWLTPPKPEEVPETGAPATPAVWPSRIATVLLAVSILAAIGLYQIPGVGAAAVEEPDFTKFPTRIGAWKRQFEIRQGEFIEDDLPFNEEVKTKLTYNAAMNRRYVTDSKLESADVWVIYWKSAMTVKDYHHPDVCYVNAGDTLDRSSIETLKTRGGRMFQVSYREFLWRAPDGREYRKHVIYWTQEGRRIWTEEDEKKAASFLFPFHWLDDRLNGRRQSGQTDDRLVIHIGMPQLPGIDGKATLMTFAGQIADETYKLCPWADPKTP